jgi:hypothetical protein
VLRSDRRCLWLFIVLSYIAVFIVGTTGTFLAYEKDSLSSDAWRCWSASGPHAWERDAARLLVAAVLSLFMLWNMDSMAAMRGTPRERFLFDHPHRYEVAIFWFFIGLVLFFHLTFLPSSFRHDLPSRAALNLKQNPANPYCPDIAHKVATDDFGQIMKPYIPYMLYATALWIGVVTPVFMVLLRRIRADWVQWRERRDSLDACLSPLLSQSQTDDTAPARFFERLRVAFQNYVIGLKEVAERYFPVLLAVSLALLYEQLTTSKETVTTTAVESGKVALWFLLGPTLLICITMVAIGYQNAARKAESGFRALAVFSSKHHGPPELPDRLAMTRSRLMWEESPAGFVLSVVKSATISIPLLLAITAYIVHTLSGPEGWLGIFVPQIVINFVHRVFA